MQVPQPVLEQGYAVVGDPLLKFEEVTLPDWAQRNVRLRFLRLDLIDERIGGNKWFKLLPNFVQAQAAGCKRIVSFGGAWSNHLHALAAAGARFGIDTVGIVRGEAAHGLTPTLADAHAWGMQLEFVGRQEYRRRADAQYLAELAQRYAPCVLIPEGGSNAAGIAGCEAIGRAIIRDEQTLRQHLLAHRHVVLAVATGGTLCGLARALDEHFIVHAIPVLHAGNSIAHMLASWAPNRRCEVRIVHGYEQGGYARLPVSLAAFIDRFQQHSGIELDAVYTGKAMFALHDLVMRGAFAAGSDVVFVHTGGLQGNRGPLNSNFADQSLAARLTETAGTV
jgi:1-aminocyclopropane-1-carboxylate deaminase